MLNEYSDVIVKPLEFPSRPGSPPVCAVDLLLLWGTSLALWIVWLPSAAHGMLAKITQICNMHIIRTQP